MNKLLCALWFCFATVGAAAQQRDSTAAADSVYLHPEDMPVFPGGNAELSRFLAKNINYSKEAKGQAVSGTVVVNFIVEKNGALSDIKISQGVHAVLDSEVLRVTKLMKKWTPAKHNGEAVRCRLFLPVYF